MRANTGLIISALALVVSICAATFSFLQMQISKDTAQRQLRAYGIVARAKLKEIAANTVPEARIGFENVGQTPGYNAAWTAGINVIPGLPGGVTQTADCAEIMRRPEANHWYFGKQLFADKWRDSVYGPAEVKAINEGTVYILLTGRLCYADIFQKNHHTDFCLYWQSRNGVIEYEQPQTCQYREDAD